LRKTFVKWDAATLKFTPICSYETLKQQQALMGQLLHILEVRAEIEKIELPIVYIR